MESILEKYIVRMLSTESIFYASLLSQMQRIETDKIPTAGVTIQNGRIVLYWNPKFLEGLPADEALGVLEHECLHLVMCHLTRVGERDSERWNIAADLAINQLIKKVPAGCVQLSCFPKNWKLPQNSTAEVYYRLIEQNSSSITVTPNADGKSYHVTIRDKKGKVTSEFDVTDIGDHSKWQECEGNCSSELTKEIIRKAVRHAKEQVDKTSGRGSYPGELDTYIEELLSPPVVPWQTLLRQFIAFSIKCGHKFTWKRPSRRFGEDQKGRLPARQVAITIGIDTSGSISTADLQSFFNEIRGIQACYKSDITVLECDACIQKEYKLTNYSQPQVNVKGRGGTRFEPVFEYIKEKRIKTDVLIYFTDLAGSFPDVPPNYPTLWLSTTECEKAPFGRVISMPKHQPKQK